MLARRFTIVCLIVALFGMGMAMLVAETGRQSHWQAAGGMADCNFAGDYSCLPVRHWQERPVR